MEKNNKKRIISFILFLSISSFINVTGSALTSWYLFIQFSKETQESIKNIRKQIQMLGSLIHKYKLHKNSKNQKTVKLLLNKIIHDKRKLLETWKKLQATHSNHITKHVQKEYLSVMNLAAVNVSKQKP